MKREILRRKRMREGFTQIELANAVNIKFSTYCKKERGETKFSIDEALKIAEVLGCKVEDIFLLSEQPNGRLERGHEVEKRENI